MRGPLRDILLCHCEECRRGGGYLGAFTSTQVDDFVFVEERGLRWTDSPRSDRNARRGFCGECGSSLFWDAPDRDTISVSAGALDPPTGLRTTVQIYTHQASDYYELDSSLPST